MRLILPPDNCYNAAAAVRPVVSGLPAQQSLDQPLCDASQATLIVSALTLAAVAPLMQLALPQSENSPLAEVGNDVTIIEPPCRDHLVKFASRLPCGGPLAVLAHQSLPGRARMQMSLEN